MMIDKKTGFLVKEGDSNDIIEKLNELLNNNVRAKEMGIEGTKLIKKEFNWERVAKNFLNIIKPYVNIK